MSRGGFVSGYPIPRKNPDPWDKNPRDIPKVKNSECRGFFENPGEKNPESRGFFENTGDKNLEIKNNPESQ